MRISPGAVKATHPRPPNTTSAAASRHPRPAICERQRRKGLTSRPRSQGRAKRSWTASACRQAHCEVFLHQRRQLLQSLGSKGREEASAQTDFPKSDPQNLSRRPRSVASRKGRRHASPPSPVHRLLRASLANPHGQRARKKQRKHHSEARFVRHEAKAANPDAAGGANKETSDVQR